MARSREATGRLWRVFPWDATARDGEPYSAGWFPAAQGQGRFDLTAAPGGVLYLAETPVHAVAGNIQHYRGQTLDEADLRVAGHPLALVAAELDVRVATRVVDLCDPAVLVQLGIRPDATASTDRRSTQRFATGLHAAGYAGLRWWSALTGDWHTVVLFRDRIGGHLHFDDPEPLSLSHSAVIEATRALGITRART